jgi:hypothetical protein
MQVRHLVCLAFISVPALLVAQKPARSDHHGADFSIGLSSGTLGFGPEISKLITSHIGLRASANFLSMTRSIDESDVSFSAKLKMKAVTGLVDLYPGARGSFHLSGGIITNPLDVQATGQPKGDGTFTINDVEYSNADVGVLTGSAKWPGTSPYVGLGFGTPANSHAGIKFTMDIGAALGKPTIALSATGAANNAQLQADLDAQVAKTQKDVNKYAKVYPVISAGLVFRF